MESSAHQQATQASLSRAEFFAEDYLLEISPMVNSSTVFLVAGHFGPFQPSIATTVPLWLALAMKKLRRCRIIPPRWLSYKELDKVIQSERDFETVLQPLPHYFSQVRLVFLHHLSRLTLTQPEVSHHYLTLRLISSQIFL